MGTLGDRNDLQSVIDFFGTPLVVDVLRAVRAGLRPRLSPDLSMYGDAVDSAIAALTESGVVTTHPESYGEPSLTLTAKGRGLCLLIDEVVDFHVPERPMPGQVELVKCGPIDRTAICGECLIFTHIDLNSLDTRVTSARKLKLQNCRVADTRQVRLRRNTRGTVAWNSGTY